MEERFPTISFCCECGKRLYTISTNVISCDWKLECSKCGLHYECSDSIIARLVSPSTSGKQGLHAARPNANTCAVPCSDGK